MLCYDQVKIKCDLVIFRFLSRIRNVDWKGVRDMEEKTLKAATETALRKQVELLAQDGMCGERLDETIRKISALLMVLRAANGETF